MHDLVTFLLAGGRGERLRPLTDCRPKPLLPFAGRRLIDFPLINCLRSEIEDVTVLAQYRSDAIARHLRRAWTGWRGHLHLFSPEDAGRPFRGTADAVRLALARHLRARTVLVLSADHVYRMDYRELIDALVGRATLCVRDVPRDRAQELGVVSLDIDGRLAAFHEKSASPPARLDRCLASMGVYVFDAATLRGWLGDHPDADDFGYDVLPGMVAEGVDVFRFDGYWRDLADVGSYHEALMDLVCGEFDPGGDWPGFRTPGCACVVAEGPVRYSVLGRGVRIGDDAQVEECVLHDDVEVGAGARLRRVVVEEGVKIAPGARLGGPGGVTAVTRESNAASLSRL